MVTFEHIVQDEAGLHARPAGLLVKMAQSLPDEITVAKGGKTADAKRMFAVIGLGVKHGEAVTFTITGDTATETANQLKVYCKQNI